MRGSVTTARTTATTIAPASCCHRSTSGKIGKGSPHDGELFYLGYPMSLRVFIRDVLPVVLWMIVIYSLSTSAGGATHTNSGLDAILARYFPFLNRALTWGGRDAIHYYVRKAAHVTEYAVLGILIVRALRHVCGVSSRGLWSGAWLLATAYAASDEFHQIFVPGRTPKVTDVMLDSAGVLLGLGIMLLRQKRMSRREAE